MCAFAKYIRRIQRMKLHSFADMGIYVRIFVQICTGHIPRRLE
jgi:hypothetical protein